MSARALLEAPMAAALLEFNLLPSRTLHPCRWATFLPSGWAPPEGSDAALHRHLSSLILGRLGLAGRLADDPGRPEWPVALAPPALRGRACRWIALVLAQERIRHAVQRDAARVVAQALDAESLAFARHRAPQLGVADGTLADAPLGQLVTGLDDIGHGALVLALAHAPAALRDRAALRCSPTARQPGLAPAAALALALRVLQELDPPWMSCFPATH